MREQTLRLVGCLSEDDLTRVHSPIMSPLVWDLGHIAAYEDLWLGHRLAGLELLRPELASVYDAFETPRAVRGDIAILKPAQARAYMDQVRERVSEAIADHGVGDGQVCEMVVRHELQHTETMRQTMAIAGLLPPGEPPALDRPRLEVVASARGGDGDGDEGWIELDAGSFAMGAEDGVFAYDNERPRHTVALGAYRIAKRPVSNASWMRFAEGGGYERREWWSDEGWAWKEEYDITHHPDITHPAVVAAVRAGEAGGVGLDSPVCHVSWFEAGAFARAHEARLPSEAEWERAATRGQQTPESPGLGQVGQVWEWTSSTFGGYPGFVAHPYKEYSEVFFDQGYRVLRGGSWATHPRVKTVTFRNWDLPERRQIFAGLRLARDGA